MDEISKGMAQAAQAQITQACKEITISVICLQAVLPRSLERDALRDKWFQMVPQLMSLFVEPAKEKLE